MTATINHKKQNLAQNLLHKLSLSLSLSRKSLTFLTASLSFCLLSNFANATTYTETKDFIDKGNGVYAYENPTETSISLSDINELGSQLRKKVLLILSFPLHKRLSLLMMI